MTYNNPKDPEEKQRDLQSWQIIFPGMFLIFGFILGNMISNGPNQNIINMVCAGPSGALGYGVYHWTIDKPYKIKTKYAVILSLTLLSVLILISVLL